MLALAAAACGGGGKGATTVVAGASGATATVGVAPTVTITEPAAPASDAADGTFTIDHVAGAPELAVTFPDDFDPNTWTATVVARRPLTAAEERRLRRQVDAWFAVGNLGGYGTADAGGQPFGDLEVTISKDRRRLALAVDAGDPDMEGADAFSTLVRMLEGMTEIEGIPLRAVIFS